MIVDARRCRIRRACVLTGMLAAAAACRSLPDEAPWSPELKLIPIGDAIVVCGQRFAIGAPVVLWTDPGGYSAYSSVLRFPEDPPVEAPIGLRYQPGRRMTKQPGSKELRLGAMFGTPRCLDDLKEAIDQFVLHYDVCGTSRQCFKVLHDRRKLSVHFMLDIDGTLYQTLDLSDTAWHARQANPRSVGVEIANIGAYPPGSGTLEEWYGFDGDGVRIRLPERMGDGGVRTPSFVGRPARPERVRGMIHGVEYEMYDLTPEQYVTLAKLAAQLSRIFPKLALDAPRDAQGAVRPDALAGSEFEQFRGLLGHYHVTRDKQDPGPAFDWEAVLERARELRAAQEI